MGSKTFALRLTVGLYLGLLLGVSILAYSGSGVVHVMRHVPHADKIGHFVLFGGAALLLELAFPGPLLLRRPVAVHRSTLLLVLVVTADEFLQHFSSTRAFSFADLGADYLGVVVLGLLVPRLLCR
jgi:VanZ family protein